MVARKVILAVAIATVAFVQVNGAPADTDWAAPFEAALKNLTSKISDAVNGDMSEYTTMAKNGLNTFADGFKSEMAVLSKTLDGKAGVSDVVKEATKQWEKAVETYSKNVPEDLSVKKLNERYESTLKYITQHATEISNKVKGNGDVEKEIREFTKKQIDSLMDNLKTVQNKLTEKKN